MSSGVPKILEWEGQAAAGTKGVGCGERLCPSPTGERVWEAGCAPSPENCDFFVENTIF